MNLKNRAEYLEGEHRFQNSQKNTSNLIKIWAEKEFANLKRLSDQLINCPTPIVVKGNILVMKFIGKDGNPARQLKQTSLKEDALREVYMDCITMMRNMYHKCHLVHGDLSEFNILYKNGNIWFIDVSQAVEHDHPNAVNFLKRDCQSITSYFKKQGIFNALSTRQLFDFVTDLSLSDDNVDAYLEKLLEIIDDRVENPLDEEEAIKEEVTNNVFMNDDMNIPRTLNKIEDPFVSNNGDAFYQALTGMKSDLSGPLNNPEIFDQKIN